jgi:(2Fe-2S) ferredoxin
MMGYYQKHVFFCTNQKDAGKQCCATADAVAMWQYAKERCSAEGLSANSNVRISTAGCLGQCAQGPCVVVYPEGRWYTYHSRDDVDKLIEQELMDDEPVAELLLAADKSIVG